MARKKCDICRKQEVKEEPFARAYKQTTKTYQPTKEDPLHIKTIMRTKPVWLCPKCYLKEVKGKKLKEVACRNSSHE